jgi:hypothetical protein
MKERKQRQGIDIEAEKQAVNLIIEVEGSQKPDGKPLTGSQMYTHFYRAIGQVCRRMSKDKNTKYVILIPDHNKYITYVKEMTEAIKRLKLNIVSKQGTKYFLLNRKQDF